MIDIFVDVIWKSIPCSTIVPTDTSKAGLKSKLTSNLSSSSSDPSKFVFLLF